MVVLVVVVVEHYLEMLDIQVELGLTQEVLAARRVAVQGKTVTALFLRLISAPFLRTDPLA
jgi:hypothetical protein